MEEEGIGKRAGCGGAEVGPGTIVGGDKGLAGDVAGGGHERTVADELVERGVGREKPHAGQARVDRRGKRRIEAGDAVLGDGDREKFDGGGGSLGDIGEARHHDGKGFIGTILALAKRCHGLLVGGIAHEVETPDALDGDDGAGVEQGRDVFPEALRCRGGERGRVGDGRVLFQPRGGTTVIAADRLGVVAAVGGVGVLVVAGGAHGEIHHRRARPVVGEIPDDRQPRATISARDKRVVVAPVGGVVEFAATVLAHRGIRGKKRLRCALAVGGGDDEPGLILNGGNTLRVCETYKCQRRHIRRDVTGGGGELLGRALEFHNNVRVGVGNPTGYCV